MILTFKADLGDLTLTSDPFNHNLDSYMILTFKLDIDLDHVDDLLPLMAFSYSNGKCPYS